MNVDIDTIVVQDAANQSQEMLDVNEGTKLTLFILDSSISSKLFFLEV
jgi:hypothetical protein